MAAHASVFRSYLLIWFIGSAGLFWACLLTRRKFIALKRARRSVKLSEHKYRQLFNEATYGIGLVERETGIIVECNAALAVIAGCQPARLLGQHQNELQPHSVLGEEIPLLFRVPKDESHGELFEGHLMTCTGDERIVEIKTNMLELDGIELIQGIFHDVTDVQRAQREAIARDLRFRAIFEAAESVAFVISEANATEKILEFSPGAEQIFGYERAEVVGLPLSQLAALHNPADSTQLHQVLLNLCTNAYQSMGDDGGVPEVGLEAVSIVEGENDHRGELKVGDCLLLSVRDAGSGMDAATLERIFDPFYMTKEPGEGTGLGLSTVHTIIKNHGGVILVDTELGQGTAFSVYLPRYYGKKRQGDAA